MYSTIQQLVKDRIPEAFGLSRYTGLITFVIALMLIALICSVLRLLVKGFIVKVAGRITKHTKATWIKIFYEHKVFHRTANFVIPVVISAFADSAPEYSRFIMKLAGVAGAVVFVRFFAALANSAQVIYSHYEISRIRPIHSLIQVITIAVYIASGIITVAILLGESPMVLIGGIGAMTAVTSLIFKDPILGFVAGIQLTANDMIRIGDWIEMPKYSADGTVIELSMTTVKVENFDKTITSIPAYTLVSDAFINWRGMEAAGGRRIKRAIYMDAADVRLCDEEMLEKFGKIALIKDYIADKLKEVEAYNADKAYDLTIPVNGRRLTNLGTFRAYMTAYLKQHPHIHKEMICMVRQLKPEDKGIPLEIYCFTSTTAWVAYENIQADIFDHLFAVAREFGLHIFQQPSGNDLRGRKA